MLVLNKNFFFFNSKLSKRHPHSFGEKMRAGIPRPKPFFLEKGLFLGAKAKPIFRFATDLGDLEKPKKKLPYLLIHS
jgi:hypothetical protein